MAGVPVKDTIKIIGQDKIVENTPDRNTLWITQTPQAFQSNLVRNAYNKLINGKISNITDDAMVVEQFTDHKVRFVWGSYTNIKITTPEDIDMAELFLSKTQNIV